jgi:hypothetical protein
MGNNPTSQNPEQKERDKERKREERRGMMAIE